MAPELPYVLVVDDSADTADSMAELLTLCGYDAASCVGGEAALACARRRRPAAVLLDLIMPRMSGLQFLRLFRTLAGCRAVPVVAVTGSSCPEHIARARDAGIRHYLLKPAALIQLWALLGMLTRHAEQSSRRCGAVRRARRGVRPATGGWGRTV